MLAKNMNNTSFYFQNIGVLWARHRRIICTFPHCLSHATVAMKLKEKTLVKCALRLTESWQIDWQRIKKGRVQPAGDFPLKGAV